MAKLNYLFGKARGSIDQITFSSWKNIRVAKKKIEKNTSNSELQKEVRSKFTTVVDLLKSINPVIKIGWAKVAKNMTPMNAAMSYHLKNAVTGDYPDYEIDYQKVIISRGNLPGVKDLQISTITSNEIGLEWTYYDESTTSPDDELSLCVLNHTKNDLQINIRDVVRSDASITFGLPSHWEQGDSVSIYIFLTSVDNKSVSTSQSLVNQNLT